MKRLMIAGVLLWAAACTARPQPPPPAAPAPVEEAVAAPEPLYFSMEVKRDGQVVARPKLLGEVGKTLRAEKRAPGAARADYQLVLEVVPVGRQYRLSLDFKLEDAPGDHAEFLVEHGQVRRVDLGQPPKALQLSLTLMRVDSPEFRTLMHLTEQDEARANARAI